MKMQRLAELAHPFEYVNEEGSSIAVCYGKGMNWSYFQRHL
jgi:hypothetical protein